MKAAIYTRVSTDGQDTRNQLDQLRAWCTSAGHTIAAEYEDTASGSDDSRPAFRSMLAAAHRREWDLVVFWSLDRFSRSGALVTLQHLQSISAAGVKFRSHQEPYIESIGPFGPAIVAFVATIAELERERLRERTKAGIERARRDGKTLGRPKRVFDVNQARKMIESGMSQRRVARELQVGLATLSKRLQCKDVGQP